MRETHTDAGADGINVFRWVVDRHQAVAPGRIGRRDIADPDRAGQREAALREVKASLILEQIADEEKIEVTDEELDHEVDALASQSKQTVEQVRARLTQDGGLDRIRHRLRNEKTLNSLYRKSA